MITMTSRQLPLCCHLLCLLLGCVSSEDIIAAVGTDVTLICNYDVQTQGRLFACWGRGTIPSRGCANEVIKSDGTAMISRLSERYLFSGHLDAGDVSLTIRQVEESDTGMYGCRVEIPGWFNDHKHQMTLTVVAVRPNPLKVETGEVKERSVTVRWTPGFNGGRPITSYRVDLKNKQQSWNAALMTEVYDPELTQVTLMDLRPARSYDLCVFAINSVGMSEASNVLTITTTEAAPEGPPLDIQLKALSSRMIKVTWKPPRAELRNGVLRGYNINYMEYDPAGKRVNTWMHRSVTVTREMESFVLTDLKPSTKYIVRIQAKTNAGNGPPSTAPPCSTMDEVHTTTKVATVESTSTAATEHRPDSSHFTSGYTTSADDPFTAATALTQSTIIASVFPDPPVVELKEVTGNSVRLSWTPGSEGGSPITRFVLAYKILDAPWDFTQIDFTPNQREATLIEMHPSTYSICMFAMNDQGISTASNFLNVTTEEAGQQRVDPVFTSSDTHAAVVGGESHNSRLTAIVIPLVLVVLIVVIVTAWHLRRRKQKQGSLSMWVTKGALYRSSEPLQEQSSVTLQH